MTSFVLKKMVRLRDAIGSRWRNLWFRMLGVRMTGYVLLRRISIPEGWTLISIGRGAGLDEGVTLRASGEGAEPKLSIGEGTYVNRYTIITAGERVSIGKHCLIGPHCFIADAIHPVAADRPIHEQPMTFKQVVIEDGVWLGAGCIVLAGVTLGAGCVIGAGSVVTQDIPAGTIAVSAGARVIKKRE